MAPNVCDSIKYWYLVLYSSMSILFYSACPARAAKPDQRAIPDHWWWNPRLPAIVCVMTREWLTFLSNDIIIYSTWRALFIVPCIQLMTDIVCNDHSNCCEEPAEATVILFLWTTVLWRKLRALLIFVILWLFNEESVIPCIDLLLFGNQWRVLTLFIHYYSILTIGTIVCSTCVMILPL